MIIVSYNDKNIIDNIYDVKDINMLNISQKNHLTFHNTKAYKGLHINALNEDGSVKSRIELIELGLEELKEHEQIIDGEIVVVEPKEENQKAELPVDEVSVINERIEKIKNIMIQLIVDQRLLGFVNEEMEKSLQKEYQELLTKKSFLS
ncbi:MAG: hypothetical protein ACRCVW_00140 [Brevinema sp.]